MSGDMAPTGYAPGAPVEDPNPPPLLAEHDERQAAYVAERAQARARTLAAYAAAAQKGSK
jgi:hypothetical protein